MIIMKKLSNEKILLKCIQSISEQDAMRALNRKTYYE